MNDPIGKALKDYQAGIRSDKLIVHADILDDDVIPIPYLFRSYNEMPRIEHMAINHAFGHVLDVGAGSGCHSLVLKSKGLSVTSIDTSPGAVEVMLQRGLPAVYNADFFSIKDKTFDTLIFLMNGIGIVGTLDRLDLFFEQCKSLLNDQGQVLLDSSDISYLFEEEDGSYWRNLEEKYYGELTYQFEYKKERSEIFNWLFIDFETLRRQAQQNGFSCEKLFEDDHYGYLARLKISR